MSARRGLATFFTVWIGQVVSLVGSGLSGFAFIIWVYQTTGSVTHLALLSVFFLVPSILLAPLAGALVDRWDRRKVMLLSDAGAALNTLFLWGLYSTDQLTVWHIFAINALSAVYSSFQIPAYTAATTLLVPKEHLGRTAGLMQMGYGVSQLLAPFLSGLLMVTVGLGRILLIDLATFVVAAVTLLVVRIPRPAKTADDDAWDSSPRRGIASAWRYLRHRPPLLGLLAYTGVNSFLGGLVMLLSTPVILAFASVAVLGTISSIAGLGTLVGTAVMSAWGGPRRRIFGVLGFELLSGFFLILAGLRPSVVIFGVAAFGFMFCMPIVAAAGQALWQVKVPPVLQGRVFALQRMVLLGAPIFAALLAGPLADRVFEPLLLPGGALAATVVGEVIGVGPGRGIAFLYVVLGSLTVSAAVVGLLVPALRRLDLELPDAVPAIPPAAASPPGAEG